MSETVSAFNRNVLEAFKLELAYRTAVHGARHDKTARGRISWMKWIGRFALLDQWYAIPVQYVQRDTVQVTLQ